MTEEENNANAPVPGSPDYPLHSELTLGAYLKMQTAIDPDHEFVVYPDRDLRWTYRDFDERTDNLAKGLLAIGMKPGDHLGVWARNIPDWLTFMYASAKIGVVMVTVNPVYKSHELDYVLKQSDMKALCVIDAYRDVDYLKIIRDLVPESLNVQRGFLRSEEYPFLENLIYMGPEKHRGFYSVPELLLLGQHKPDSSLEWAQGQFDNNDVVMMQYTSGTTGFPKAILHNHRALVSSCETEQKHHGQTREDVFLCIPPLYHTGAKMHWFGSLISGSRAVLLRGVKPEWILRAVTEEKCTIVWLLVPWAQDLLDAVDSGKVQLDNYLLDQWRLMHIGAQPVPPSLIRRWKQLFPHHQYDTNYGLSESIGPGCVHLGVENIHKVGAIGVPGYHWETKIVDEQWNEVPQGEIGELAVKGPGVMLCYYKNPEATAEILKDGWLYTGDMARMDGDGFIFLVDRKKDVVISGGENIYPVQIEDFLRKFDKIKDVAVIGLPDPRLGEIAAAIIELKEGAACTEETVRTGAYPIQRPFLLVTREDGALSPAAQAFLDYACGGEAGPYIARAGAVAP